MTRVAALILAAGKGTRMQSPCAKVLHKVGDKSMLQCVIEQCQRAQIKTIIVVIGYECESVRREALRCMPSVRFVIQKRQLGTGHAVRQSAALLSSLNIDQVVVLSGDVPLLRAETIQQLCSSLDGNVHGVVLSGIVADPRGLGRIVRNAHSGNIERIVEQKDCCAAETEITEINSGIYAFDWSALRAVLGWIESDNAQNEFYLTDAVRLMLANGNTVHCERLQRERNHEIIGVNTREQLREQMAGIFAAAALSTDDAMATLGDTGSLLDDAVRSESAHDEPNLFKRRHVALQKLSKKSRNKALATLAWRSLLLGVLVGILSAAVYALTAWIGTGTVSARVVLAGAIGSAFLTTMLTFSINAAALF